MARTELPTRRSVKVNSMSGNHLDLLRGADDLKDWDLDELIHGRRRDKNGNFGGRPPKVVPHIVYQEMVKRIQQVANKRFYEMVEDAQDVLEMVLTGRFDMDEIQRAKLQLQAAESVFDRTLGEPEQHINVSGTQRHEHVISDVVVDRGDMEEFDWDADDNDESDEGGDIVDAEIVEEEESGIPSGHLAGFVE